MKPQNLFLLIFFCFSLFTLPLTAQTDSLPAVQEKEVPRPAKAEGTELTKILQNITFGGVFQAHYLTSLSSGVNYKGVHYGDEKHSSNSFDIRRMRIQMQATITEKMKVVVLANFADFKTDPKNKVLENAYLSYDHNKYLNFRIGQFRPKVGPENTYAVDVVKSLDFSNAYYGFSSNGWGSFQVGADLSGNVNLGKIPLSYNVAVFNGNNRNKTDDDNGKLFFTREVFTLSKKYGLNIGLNGGWGRASDKDVHFASADISALIPITTRWSASLEAQAGEANNYVSFFSTEKDLREGPLSDYIMRGWYALPNIRYELGNKHLHSLELSCRYEQWENNKLDNNLGQTITPAFSMEFIKNYKLRLTLAMQMNRFKHSIPQTDQYNSNLFITQLQARF